MDDMFKHWGFWAYTISTLVGIGGLLLQVKINTARITKMENLMPNLMTVVACREKRSDCGKSQTSSLHGIEKKLDEYITKIEALDEKRQNDAKENQQIIAKINERLAALQAVKTDRDDQQRRAGDSPHRVWP